MHTFLFDIVSDVGHIRVTLQLASLLQERGHEVYYTDSSDSEFTSGLLQKGIGRVVYPDDLCWFVPDLVLLDSRLKQKSDDYRQRQIAYIYVNACLLSQPFATLGGSPVFALSPALRADVSLPIRQQLLPEFLKGAGKRSHSVVIAGLLEVESPSKVLARFYEVLKESCRENEAYCLILLGNTSWEMNQLFPLPENACSLRLMSLSALLSVCDVVLTTGELNTLIECIYARCPFVFYPLSGKAELADYAARAARLGLGHCRDVRKITPRQFRQHIEEALAGKEETAKQAEQVQAFFERDNEHLEQSIEQLITLIENKER